MNEGCCPPFGYSLDNDVTKTSFTQIKMNWQKSLAFWMINIDKW